MNLVGTILFSSLWMFFFVQPNQVSSDKSVQENRIFKDQLEKYEVDYYINNTEVHKYKIKIEDIGVQIVDGYNQSDNLIFQSDYKGPNDLVLLKNYETILILELRYEFKYDYRFKTLVVSYRELHTTTRSIKSFKLEDIALGNDLLTFNLRNLNSGTSYAIIVSFCNEESKCYYHATGVFSTKKSIDEASSPKQEDLTGDKPPEFPLLTDKYNFQILVVKGESRVVRIFWQYRTEYKEMFQKVLLKIIIRETGWDSRPFTKFVNLYVLPKNKIHFDYEISFENHYFQLYFVDNTGSISDTFKEIIVPAQEKIFKTPAFTATYSKTDGYTYKWTYPIRPFVGKPDQTMVWCDSIDKRGRTCGIILDQMNFDKEFRGPEMNLKFEKYRPMALILFTGSGQSTGIVLPHCENTIEKVGILDESPYLEFSYSTIEITWTMQCPQEFFTYEMTAFNVYYCPTVNEDCKIPETKLTIKSEENFLKTIIRNITPNTIYKISAAAVLPNGSELVRSVIKYQT